MMWQGVERSDSYAPVMESLETRTLLSSVTQEWSPTTKVFTYTDAEQSVVTVTLARGVTVTAIFQDIYETDADGNVILDENGLPVVETEVGKDYGANPILIFTNSDPRAATIKISVKNDEDRSIKTTTVLGLNLGAGIKSVSGGANVSIEGYEVVDITTIAGEASTNANGHLIFTDGDEGFVYWDATLNGTGGFVDNEGGEIVDLIGIDLEGIGAEGYTQVFDADTFVFEGWVAINAEFAVASAAGMSITLGNLTKVDVTLGGAAGKVVNFRVGEVIGVSIAAGHSMAITAACFTGTNSIVALFITSFNVKASFSGTIELRGANNKGVSLNSLRVGQVFKGTISAAAGASAGRINSFTAGVIEDSVIRADSIGSLTARGYRVSRADPAVLGDIDANIQLTGDDAPRGVALNSVRASGDMSGTIKAVTGSVGSISVAREFTANVSVDEAGIKSMTVGVFDAGVQAASIGSLAINGYRIDRVTSVAGDMAGSVVLSGEGVTRGNVLNSLRVSGSMSGGVTVQTGSVGSVSIAREFKDGSGITVSEAGIRSVTVGDFAGDIAAVSIGSLSVRGYKIGRDSTIGNMTGGVYLSGDVAAGNALNSATIQGVVSGYLVVENGNVGSVTIQGNGGTEADSFTGFIYIEGTARSVTIRNVVAAQAGTEAGTNFIETSYPAKWILTDGGDGTPVVPSNELIVGGEDDGKPMFVTEEFYATHTYDDSVEGAEFWYLTGDADKTPVLPTAVQVTEAFSDLHTWVAAGTTQDAFRGTLTVKGGTNKVVFGRAPAVKIDGGAALEDNSLFVKLGAHPDLPV